MNQMTTAPEPSEDDTALFRRWILGDPAAGKLLYQRHHPRLLTFLTRRIGEADTQDVAQQVWLTLGEAGRRMLEAGEVTFCTSFRSYLFGIAKNLLFAHLREKYQQAAFDPFTSSIMSIDPSLSQVFSDRVRTQRLALAMQTLPVDTQCLLDLRYREEFSIAELADLYKLPEGTMKSRLRLARTALEKLLGDA